MKHSLTPKEQAIFDRFARDQKELFGVQQLVLFKTDDPRAWITKYLDMYDPGDEMQLCIVKDPNLADLLKPRIKTLWLGQKTRMYLLKEDPDGLIRDYTDTHQLPQKEECIFVASASTKSVVTYINKWKLSKGAQRIVMSRKEQEPILALIRKYYVDPSAELLLAMRRDVEGKLLWEYRRRNNIGPRAKKILTGRGLL